MVSDTSKTGSRIISVRTIEYFGGSPREKQAQELFQCMELSISRGRGFDSGSNKEFIKFLGYALRSATELQSHLYVAIDQGYIKQEEFILFYDRIAKCKKLISGFVRYLRSNPKP